MALARCPSLEVIEVDFDNANVPGQEFVESRDISVTAIESLLSRSNRLVHTPELVSLARRHPDFDELYMDAPWTQPVSYSSIDSMRDVMSW